MSLVELTIVVTPDGRVSRLDAAKFLGCTTKTLAEWKRLGVGPMPHKVGGRVFYYVCDLRAFVATGSREAV